MRIHPATALLALAASATLGWFAHTTHTVRAADSGPSGYQFQGTGSGTVLSLYDANEHNLYVYQGVMSGNSQVNCSYKLHISHTGAPLERTNCAIGTLR